MIELITVIIIIGIVWLLCKIPDWKFDNRTPPPGYKTDWDAMNQDMSQGKSKMDVKKKYNNGGYDIPKK